MKTDVQPDGKHRFVNLNQQLEAACKEFEKVDPAGLVSAKIETSDETSSAFKPKA